MTLGDLIRNLEACPNSNLFVEIRGGYAGKFHSYRGFYDQLALGIGAPRTIADLLEAAQAAVNEEFEGYKGGTYTMSCSTPVWAAEWGEWPGEAIVGLMHLEDAVRLVTANIEEYV